MEFSKKIMVFASVLYGATWTVVVFSWFSLGEIPLYLIQFATWLYGAAFVSYCCKSAYEKVHCYDKINPDCLKKEKDKGA